MYYALAFLIFRDARQFTVAVGVGPFFALADTVAALALTLARPSEQQPVQE